MDWLTGHPCQMALKVLNYLNAIVMSRNFKCTSDFNLEKGVVSSNPLLRDYITIR